MIMSPLLLEANREIEGNSHDFRRTAIANLRRNAIFSETEMGQVCFRGGVARSDPNEPYGTIVTYGSAMGMSLAVPLEFVKLPQRRVVS